jgi:transposase
MDQQKECLCCGQPFEPTCHHTRQKYCSRACCVKYNNAKRYYSTPMDSCPNCGGTAKRGRRVFLVCGETNMHLGLDGLVNVIRYRLNLNPYDGSLYVFCDFSGTNLKYLGWHGAGFCIAKRRAQSGSYPWPPSEAGMTLEIPEREFAFLKAESIIPIGKKRKPKKAGRPRKDRRRKENKSMKKR